MNFVRLSVVAMSVALMFLVGSSSASANYSHPSFSVADDRTFNLREAGSKTVMEKIKDAIHQGGVALLGVGFHHPRQLRLRHFIAIRWRRVGISDASSYFVFHPLFATYDTKPMGIH